MDIQSSDIPGKSDSNKSVSSSNSLGDRSLPEHIEGVALKNEEKDKKIGERVQDMVHDSKSSKSEWTTSTASIHLTTSVSSKAEVFEEEEEGELDYEEDDGEIAAVQQDRNGIKSDYDGDKEEGELENDEQEEGEEGEILSDEDNKAVTDVKLEEKRNIPDEADGPEEGEVIEEGDSSGVSSLRKKVCRYFMYGGCTWGMSCRFLHPGHNDKGAYQMLPVPGQYPSPFPKPPAISSPVPTEAIVQASTMPPFIEHDQQEEMAIPDPPLVPKKETAWERGLKLAKEIKKAAQKRKEEDADFEEKRMILGITVDDNDDENDKENLARRRELMRSRLEKDLIFDEDESRYRRGGDIVSRWRDKRPTSPVQFKDRDRRKRRGNRTPSSSPERERRNRRRTGDKERPKAKSKDTTRDRDKEQISKPVNKEPDVKREEKVKKQKEKDQDTAEEKQPTQQGKKESEVAEEKSTKEKEQVDTEVKQQRQERVEQRKLEPDDKGKLKVPEKTENNDIKPTTETDSKMDLNDSAALEKDKLKTKVLGISSSRLPNDEWMDPWQRTTSPKRHSVSSASSRSRSSSSSSDSSRSSRSRSRSGSESRSSSHSASRSRSRSVSQTPSRSPSRSRSGSRSKSRSRSGSASSASEHSSSSSSKSVTAEVKENEGGEERSPKQASHDSSESESGSESNKSISKSPTPVAKSPVKPKPAADKGPRTPPKESTLSRSFKDVKERKHRVEYGRGDRIEKWREGQMRQVAPSNRRMDVTRPPGDHYRDRGHYSRRRRTPDRRRRSRSPTRARIGDRRRPDEGRARERSSSADSMEHALARPSSPRPLRERGGMRRGSSASSSGSESASSDSGSESEEERHPVRTRRAGPEAEKVKRNIPLSSGNIRYTGHKDIKLTLNKSVSRPDRGEAKPPSHHPPPDRTEISNNEKQALAKKRPRDSSPVLDASSHGREAVSSSVSAGTSNKADRRSTDTQVDAATSGKANTANTSSRREELLRELKAVEDAIARKRARIE